MKALNALMQQRRTVAEAATRAERDKTDAQRKAEDGPRGRYPR